jgi:alpha-1,2-mannosyltransferase
MVGSCRGPDDDARLQQLQQYAEQLGLADAVEWHVNVPYSELKQLLGGAVGGLHTMLDEHFGISVVEYMAAGVAEGFDQTEGTFACRQLQRTVVCLPVHC